MFKKDEYLVYRKDVCKVKDIITKDNTKYYQLIPISDETLKIEVPVEDKDNVAYDLFSELVPSGEFEPGVVYKIEGAGN